MTTMVPHWGGASPQRRRCAFSAVVALAALAGCADDHDGRTAAVAITSPSSPGSATIPSFSVSASSPTDPTPRGGSWAVSTAGCADPAAATAPIVGTLTIGTVAPQSGGLISAIYAPVVQGFQAYVDHANAAKMLGDVRLGLVVADDQGRADLTPVAVDGLLAAGAQVVSGVLGSANNLAVRASLNRECVPQLMALGNSTRLGDVNAAPWTVGALVPVTVEATVYVNSIVRSQGESARVALVMSGDDTGQAYASSFLAAASATGMAIVDQETIGSTDIEPPTEAILRIAAQKPAVVVASLSGAVCATFLTELGKARAALRTWKPAVYMASGCADSSILTLAGAAADGVLTSTNLVDHEPTFDAAMAAAGVKTGFGTAAEGWTAAEVTVAILRQAQASPAGLTRASIIDAARNLSYTPSLARPNVQYTTNGADDPFPAESLQMISFVAATRTFVDVGPLIAQFES